jgi:hypothetical protein
MYVGIWAKLRRKWFISQGSGSFQRAGALPRQELFKELRSVIFFLSNILWRGRGTEGYRPKPHPKTLISKSI